MEEDNDQKIIDSNTQIIDRLKAASGVDTDASLAKILGIKPQNITYAKKNRVPNRWVVKISKVFHVDVSFLLHGKTTKSRIETERPIDKNTASITITDTGPNLGDAVNILAEILKSGDSSIIQALHSNLLAFREAVQSTGSLAKLQQEIQRLKEENARLRDRISQSRLTNIEHRIELIERLYLDQVQKDRAAKPEFIEQRNIMLQLGNILGYDNNGMKKDLNDENQEV